jgi:hypothetical protein
MHEDSLSQDSSNTASVDARIDAHVVRALEQLPELSISTDFAARVAARVPARKPVSIRATHYGRTVAFLCVFVLFAALLAVSPRGMGNSALGLAVEWLLTAQFLGLIVWLGLWRRNAS